MRFDDTIGHPFAKCALVTAVFAGVTLAPPLLWWSRVPIINFNGTQQELFRLFGGCASLALLGYATIHRRQLRTGSSAISIALFVLIGFHFLYPIAEHSSRSWDYSAYERASKTVDRGGNPYPNGGYLYPPAMAQGLALEYRLVGRALALSPDNTVDQNAGWDLVFYFWQCGLFASVLLAYVLCVRFARTLGWSETRASILAAVLFVFNTSVSDCLSENQVGLWMLDLVLLAILLQPRRPWAAGLLAALGGGVKLYPAMLAIPWTLGRRWKAVATTALGFGGLGLVELAYSRTLLTQYLTFQSTFPLGLMFRNNSLRSMVASVSALCSGWFGLNDDASLTRLASLALLLLAGGWFAFRIIRRESDPASLPSRKLLGHTMDALGMMILFFSMVWKHSYVLALPILVWAAVTVGRERPWALGIGAVLMCGLPTVDVFPFSYHSTIGLLLVLHLVRPQPEVPLAEQASPPVFVETAS